MKNRKSKLTREASPKPAKTPAASKPLTLAELQRGASIFDRYFSVEQQAQINRLQNACDMEGQTESEAVDKTIATLAQAALWALGLDPLSDDAFTRISDIVLGTGADAEISNDLFDRQLLAQDWTKAQRAAEIGEAPCSATAEATS